MAIKKNINPHSNIKAMQINIPKLGEAKIYGYKYDQLNRLTKMDAYEGLNNGTNVFTAIDINGAYKERISYDANGNIQTYLRNGDAARLSMDNMTYSYKANTNQLDKVTDAAPDAAAGDYDKYNDIKQGQQNGNYQYDAIGNLTSDVSEGITNIDWNVYGKIKHITKSGGNIFYTYDAAGNRISKTYNGKSTFYVRDASGNVMSVYVKDAAINNNHLTQQEVHLYGSSRLGILNVNTDMEIAHTQGYGWILRGNKFFELVNHLGNVLATVSDKKIGVDVNGDGIVDYYIVDVISAQDYAPGGMTMPGRKYNSDKAVYGFNGMRKDNEMYGEGNAYDFGSRILDPRLGGRWLSVDPLMKKYPGESPYLYTGGNPILYVDLDGKDRIVSFYYLTAKGERVLINRTTYKQAYEITYGVNRAINFFETGRYYKADIEQTVVLDLASGKIVENYQKEGLTKPISLGDYLWGAPEKSSMSQSKAKGSYQDYGYSVTGNSNGENIDFIDKAGETLGSINIGGLLDVLSVAGADPAAFFESFDKSALENVLTGLEKIKATKETQEVIKIVKENANELLGKRGEVPTSSSSNTKTGTAQQAASSTKSISSAKKSTKADSIFVHERTLNGKPVPTNDTTPYNNETIKKVSAPKN